jgi:hypothetical protein
MPTVLHLECDRLVAVIYTTTIVKNVVISGLIKKNGRIKDIIYFSMKFTYLNI